MANLFTEIMNPVAPIAKTPKELVYPTMGALSVPIKPNYREGKRLSVNAYGTTELEAFAGDSKELAKLIGADFKASKANNYTKAGDKIEGSYYVYREDNNKILNPFVTDVYSVFQYTDVINFYMSFLEELKKHGVESTPAYGKVYDEGRNLFLQHKLEGYDILGDKVDTYLSLITSHASQSSVTLALTSVRLICQNQINRALGCADAKIMLKHTNGNNAKLKAQADKLISLEEANKKALTDYCEKLATIKVTNEQIFKAMMIAENVAKMSTQAALDHVNYKCEQLFACYNMADVDPYRGTALGAYYAYSDYKQHVIPTKKTAEASFRMEGIEGNKKLANFIDILCDIAK